MSPAPRDAESMFVAKVFLSGLAIGAALAFAVGWALFRPAPMLESTRPAYEKAQREHAETVDRLAAAAARARSDADQNMDRARVAEARLAELAEQLPPEPPPPPPPVVLAGVPREVADRLRYFEEVFAPQMRVRTQALQHILAESEAATDFWRKAAYDAQTSADQYRIALTTATERAETAEARVRLVEQARPRHGRITVAALGVMLAALALAAR